MDNLILPTKNTWCPGCGNFAIQNTLKEALSELDLQKTVVVTGIGCHGKMSDYLNINTFTSLHGRTIPLGTGIKLANKELTVFCVGGDGDMYSEGISHLIHAGKRNSNITVMVHDNRVFALTVKQPTSTSPKGFVTTTSPKGSIEFPLNPLAMMLSIGSTFVARAYSSNQEQLKRIILEGAKHKGFSFIEILQPCPTWNNTYSAYNELVYQMEEEYLPIREAKEKATEWNYNDNNKIATGIFYKEERPTFEDQLQDIYAVNFEKLLEERK